jgi:ATP-dependent DNA ligase
MLATAVDEVPGPDALPGGTVWEPKWDGFRALATWTGDRVAVTSRRTKDLTGAFPDIARAVRSQLHGPLVLDGELVVWADGRLDFTALQQRLVAGRGVDALAREHPASYVIFDLLAIGHEDLTNLPWSERRARLLRVLGDARPPLQLCPSTTDRTEALEWFDTWAPLGVEGLVAKGRSQPYLPGRRGWLKVRHRHSAEAIVGAVVGPLDNPERLVLGALDDTGVLRVVGSTGPLSTRDAPMIGRLLCPPSGGHPWPAELPSAVLGGLAGQRPPTPISRAEPTLVVEVSVDTAFERGRWRHLARLVRMRADVDADDVTVAGLARP